MKFLPFLFLSFFLGSFGEYQDDLAASMARGEELYAEYCIQCHLPNGKGLTGVNPPLAGSDYLLEDPVRGIRAIQYGQQGKITVNGVEYNSYMASPGLEDSEIADVMNYILHSWGNESKVVVTEEMVAKVEKK